MFYGVTNDSCSYVWVISSSRGRSPRGCGDIPVLKDVPFYAPTFRVEHWWEHRWLRSSQPGVANCDYTDGFTFSRIPNGGEGVQALELILIEGIKNMDKLTIMKVFLSGKRDVGSTSQLGWYRDDYSTVIKLKWTLEELLLSRNFLQKHYPTMSHSIFPRSNQRWFVSQATLIRLLIYVDSFTNQRRLKNGTIW